MEEIDFLKIASNAKDLGTSGAVFAVIIYCLKALVSMMISSITNREQTIQNFFGQALSTMQKSTEQSAELHKTLNDFVDNIKKHTEVLGEIQKDVNIQSAKHRIELIEAITGKLEPFLKLAQKPDDGTDKTKPTNSPNP